MVSYEVVELAARTVTGLAVHTANGAPDCSEKIGGLWSRFMGGEGAALGYRPGSPCYGLYTHYTWDDDGYDAVVGCETDHCPEGCMRVEIPAGKYAKFSFHGNVVADVARFWQEIWELPLQRAYRVDFEEYLNCDGQMQGDVNIYIGLADICQSCGMPMARPEEHGTETGGTPSEEYCCYCRKDGSFAQSCTMDQMIDYCLDISPELYTDRKKSRAMMAEYFPMLARWKKA